MNRGVSCKRVKILLSAYVFDDISLKEQELLEKHVKECLSCQKALQEMRWVVSLLSYGRLEIEPSPELKLKLMRYIREEKKWRNWRWWQMPLMEGILFATITYLVVILLPSTIFYGFNISGFGVLLPTAIASWLTLIIAIPTFNWLLHRK